MAETIIELTADEVDGGYSASARGFGNHAQRDSLGELRRNIKEAVDCYFDESMRRPKLIRIHFVNDRGSRSVASVGESESATDDASFQTSNDLLGVKPVGPHLRWERYCRPPRHSMGISQRFPILLPSPKTSADVPALLRASLMPIAQPSHAPLNPLGFRRLQGRPKLARTRFSSSAAHWDPTGSPSNPSAGLVRAWKALDPATLSPIDPDRTRPGILIAALPYPQVTVAGPAVRPRTRAVQELELDRTSGSRGCVDDLMVLHDLN